MAAPASGPADPTTPCHTALGPTAPGPTAPGPTPPGTGQIGPALHQVRNEDLVLSQLLTTPVWFVPVGVLLVGLQFVAAGSHTFVGVASALTALAGVVVRPVRQVLDQWDFILHTGPVGLRLRHGLLSTRSQTVPLARVQAVRLTWPLLWRPKGWLHGRADVAGYTRVQHDPGALSGDLLPVADAAVARAVVGEVLPGVDITALAMLPAPARARWRAPLSQPVLGSAMDAVVFACRDGWLTHQLTLVPYARIQSVRVVQGPVQRWLRLASVHVDTAGGAPAVARHRDVDEAWALAGQLSVRARLARSAR